jgi:hypothetical protein
LAKIASIIVQIQIRIWNSSTCASWENGTLSLKVLSICLYASILCKHNYCWSRWGKRPSSLQNWPLRLDSWICSSLNWKQRARSNELIRKALQEGWRKLVNQRDSWDCNSSSSNCDLKWLQGKWDWDWNCHKGKS